jgi:hypothetical protein
MTTSTPAAGLIGTWEVTVCEVKFTDTGEVAYPYGKNPKGYLQYAPSGHMVVFQTSGERVVPAGAIVSDEERIRMHKAIFGGYAATYRIEGNKVIHSVVAAWNDWSGTEQIRYFELSGERLVITTEETMSLSSGRPFVARLTFQKLG